MIFDFGFERQELIYLLKNLGLGQFHDLRIRRTNRGATMVLQVRTEYTSSYPPAQALVASGKVEAKIVRPTF